MSTNENAINLCNSDSDNEAEAAGRHHQPPVDHIAVVLLAPPAAAGTLRTRQSRARQALDSRRYIIFFSINYFFLGVAPDEPEDDDRKPSPEEKQQVKADEQLAQSLQVEEAARKKKQPPSAVASAVRPVKGGGKARARKFPVAKKGGLGKRTVIHFAVKGPPLSKKRVATSRFGNKYNPSAASEKKFAKVAVKVLSKLKRAPKVFEKGTPLRINLQFRFARRSMAMTPDIDNLVKFVMDALNGIVYHDDRQVVKLWAQKGLTSATTSSTVVTISETAVPIWNDDDGTDMEEDDDTDTEEE